MRTKIILMSMCVAFMLGCRPTSDVGADTPGKPTFWKTVKSAVRNAGPYTYVVREPILLPDGSRVVCVSTHEALWCKEANE